VGNGTLNPSPVMLVLRLSSLNPSLVMLSEEKHLNSRPRITSGKELQQILRVAQNDRMITGRGRA
jgi:hypothetical protein